MARRERRRRRHVDDVKSNEQGESSGTKPVEVKGVIPTVEPAYDTKHIDELVYPLVELGATLRIRQSSTSYSTSSSIWLSSQVMAAYLLSLGCIRQGAQSPKRAIELGAGTGFLSLVLAHCGWHVTATDLSYVTQGVLKDNAAMHADEMPGSIDIRELNWLDQAGHNCDESYQLVITADTLYAPDLVAGLWDTIRSLLLPVSSSPLTGDSKVGLALLALERRDPAFIDASLASAREQFGLHLDQVEEAVLADVVLKSLGWQLETWDGVEIWRVTLQENL